ncbi:MAG: GNAT family N-acetyltransferase [bacterium]|nr:GNAT family N-acetyltransferase [bacterium]
MSVSDRNPQYHCPLRDKFINIGEADFLVVSKQAKADLPKPGEPVAQANIVFHRALEEEMDDILEVCNYFWDETEFFCFDQTFDVTKCVNILALAEGEVAGFLSHKKVDDAVVIVALNVYPEFQGQGIARLLLKEVTEQAHKQECNTLKLATSNDDLPALCLYQKLGFRITDVKVGAVAKHHGGDLKGFGGIPIRDEIRLEKKI